MRMTLFDASPNHASTRFSQIAFPIIVLTKDDRFRSRGTTGSSILDHDFGQQGRGRPVQMSGHSDLGTFNNLSIFHFYLGKSSCCISWLSIATRQSGDDIHDFSCCHLWCLDYTGLINGSSHSSPLLLLPLESSWLKSKNKFENHIFDSAMNCLLFLQHGSSWWCGIEFPIRILVDSSASRIHASLVCNFVRSITPTILHNFAGHGKSHWCFQLLTGILEGFFKYLTS